MTIKPAFLVKGDKIAIVCTARKFSSAEAKLALDLLDSWGLVGVLGQTIDLDNHQLGGSDLQRAQDFNRQLSDPTIKAIWCARGGYGSVRIIDQIDFTILKNNPKWIIGFSDVTVFHNHLNSLGIATIHGIMAFSVVNALAESKQSLHQALFGEPLAYTIESSSSNILGQSRAELVGGNLSIIYSLLGSESAIDTKGKILFIEDLDEYLYHLDRMMYNLKRNGLLKDLKGLIVGGMTKMHDNAIPFGQDAKQIIYSLVKEYNYPVIFDFPSGHGVQNNAMIFGETIKMEVNHKYSSIVFDQR